MEQIKQALTAIAQSPKFAGTAQAVHRLSDGQACPVLLEVQSLAMLREALAASPVLGTTSAGTNLPSGWVEVPSLLGHPIVRAVLNAAGLAEVLSWPCVLRVQEDAELKAH